MKCKINVNASFIIALMALIIVIKLCAQLENLVGILYHFTYEGMSHDCPLFYYSLFIVCFFQTYGTHEPYCYPINNVLFNRVRVATLFYAFISRSREQCDNYAWSPFYKLLIITQNRLDSLNTSTIIFSITVESVADCRFSPLRT